jgi:hypothetical protein
MNVEVMCEIHHFEANIPVRQAVLEAGGVVLDANFFVQNDLMMLPAILGAGLYPLPVGSACVWRVEGRDIGAPPCRLHRRYPILATGGHRMIPLHAATAGARAMSRSAPMTTVPVSCSRCGTR